MARTHPTQLLTDVVAELRGVNERLDTLIGQSAPATIESLEPSAEPVPVRLEEPVRSTSRPDEVIEIPIAEPVDAGAMPKICREQTKRGNMCGKPLPCRYHG